MRTVAGILALMAGVIFPLAMVAWLAARFNRPPRPSSDQVGLWLAFNGLLPLALVALGLRLMSPELGALPWLRTATAAAWAAALVVLLLLIAAARRAATRGGPDDR